MSFGMRVKQKIQHKKRRKIKNEIEMRTNEENL